MKYLKIFEDFVDDVELINTHNFIDFKPLMVLKNEFGQEFIDDMKFYCRETSNTNISDHAEPGSDWRVFIIKSNNKTVGVNGFYRIKDSNNPNEYWLAWFGILPEYRGTGVAKKSIEKLIEIIKLENSNFNSLMVYTEDDNIRAQKFYHKLEFEYLSSVDEYCEKNNIQKDKYFVMEDNDIVMSRKV